jgi:hypothetical protein
MLVAFDTNGFHAVVYEQYSWLKALIKFLLRDIPLYFFIFLLITLQACLKRFLVLIIPLLIIGNHCFTSYEAFRYIVEISLKYREIPVLR